MVSLLRKANTSNTMGSSTPMYTTYNSRYPGFDENDYKKLENMAISTGLTGQAKTNFMDEAYQYYYPQVYNNHKLDERQVQINNNVAQNSNALLNGDKNTEWKMKLTDLSQRAKQAKGIAYDVDDMQVINAMKTGIPNGEQLILDYLNNGSRDIFYDAGIEEDPRKKLDENWGRETWSAMKTLANVPIDSFKKWGQRTANEFGQLVLNKFYKNILGKVEDQTGVDLSGTMETFNENVIEPMKQENIMNYQNKINEEFAQKVAQNIDPDIKAYYDNKGYTKTLMEGDFNGFWYKALGDAAENWEMPVVIAASIFQPELGFALMATDSYTRENQEAFENMMNNGATYDQAEQGAVAVGLINAAVEVGLEKLLGGVETTASNQIRKLVMKNVQEEAVKMGLGGLILEAGKNQLRSSTEEGLEEVVQQLVQNAFVKTVNENQKLFEGLGTAFEGGFYNPMNIVAGGSNITQNISNGNVDFTSTKEGLNNFYNKAKEEVGKAYEALKTTTPTTEVEVESETTDNKGNIIDRVSDWGAEKLTNTVSPQDKLYKAQEPRMNTLTKEKDLEKRRANSDRSNELIIENGYMPTDTSSRLQAHDGTMRKIWSQVEEKINGGKEIMIDQNQLADKLQAYVDKQKSLGTTFNESDIAQLEREIESLRNKQIDLPTLEAKKQFYNAIIKNWGDAKVSDTMQNGLKELTHEIGVIEDNLLSEIPGEFQGLKNDFGALADTYEDVFKADMKNQRKKGAGLTETYSRIEGLGDVANGVLGMFTGKGDFGSVAKGATKLVVGKALAKASDVDFLIEQGFKGLAEEMKGKNGDTNSNIDSTGPKESGDSYLQTEKSSYNTDADLTTNENAMETTNNYQTEEDLIKQEREDLRKMKENKEEQARKDFQKQNLKEYMGDMEKGENIRVTFIKQGTDNIEYTNKVTVEKGDGYYMLKYDNGDVDFINDDEVNMWLDTKEVKGFNTVNPDVANSEESIIEILNKEPNVPSIEEIRKDFVFEGYSMDDLKNGLQVELDNYSQNVDTWQRYNDREAQHKAAINKAYIEAYKEEIKERENSPVMDMAEAKELLKNYSEEDFKRANEEYKAEKDLDEMTEEEVEAINEQEVESKKADTPTGMDYLDYRHQLNWREAEQFRSAILRDASQFYDKMEITDVPTMLVQMENILGSKEAAYDKLKELGYKGIEFRGYDDRYALNNGKKFITFDEEELGNLTKPMKEDFTQTYEYNKLHDDLKVAEDLFWEAMNSKDMKIAEQQQEEIRRINKEIDRIVFEGDQKRDYADWNDRVMRENNLGFVLAEAKDKSPNERTSKEAKAYKQAELEWRDLWEHSYDEGDTIWVDYTDESNVQTEEEHLRWVENRTKEIAKDEGISNKEANKKAEEEWRDDWKPEVEQVEVWRDYTDESNIQTEEEHQKWLAQRVDELLGKSKSKKTTLKEAKQQAEKQWKEAGWKWDGKEWKRYAQHWVGEYDVENGYYANNPKGGHRDTQLEKATDIQHEERVNEHAKMIIDFEKMEAKENKSKKKKSK